jgi:hypothetical protein
MAGYFVFVLILNRRFFSFVRNCAAEELIMKQERTARERRAVLAAVERAQVAQPVFRIHDILVWIRIRIRGSMPLTNGSGSGTFYFPLTFKMPKKTNLKKIFPVYYLFKVVILHFQRIKSQKDVTKQ